jgi:hypothetical protein
VKHRVVKQHRRSQVADTKSMVSRKEGDRQPSRKRGRQCARRPDRRGRGKDSKTIVEGKKA